MIIATKLVINNTELPIAISRFQNPNQIQITARGGTNDAAIATPASPAAIFFQPNARNATTQDQNAIPRSTSVGCVLIAISFVTSPSGSNQVKNSDVTIPSHILVSKIHIDLKNNPLFHVVEAKATHWIGLRIGAINIAHITTGVALISNPNAAIADDKNIWLRYSRCVSVSLMTTSAISFFWSPLRFQTAIFLSNQSERLCCESMTVWSWSVFSDFCSFGLSSTKTVSCGLLGVSFCSVDSWLLCCCSFIEWDEWK